MKKGLLAYALFMALTTAGWAQPIVSVYNSTSIFTKIGAGYSFGDRIWTELRYYAVGELADTPLELALHYNFVNRERHQIYAGAGIIFNATTGGDLLMLPVGVNFKPFGSMDRFTMHIEVFPTFAPGDELELLGFWGFRYRFW